MRNLVQASRLAARAFGTSVRTQGSLKVPTGSGGKGLVPNSAGYEQNVMRYQEKWADTVGKDLSFLLGGADKSITTASMVVIFAGVGYGLYGFLTLVFPPAPAE